MNLYMVQIEGFLRERERVSVRGEVRAEGAAAGERLQDLPPFGGRLRAGYSKVQLRPGGGREPSGAPLSLSHPPLPRERRPHQSAHRKGVPAGVSGAPVGYPLYTLCR